MASELGNLIRTTRQQRSIGLRELARLIERSPAYLVTLEKSDEPPGVSEETLARIANALGLEADALLALAQKTPAAVKPRTPTQIALYRLVQKLSPKRQEQLKQELEGEVGRQNKERKRRKKER